MKERENRRKSEDGFVLIAALLILLVLTLMGIAVNRSTVTEWRIAMNDRLHKETFYSADAVTELASEVLEQSIACMGLDATGQALMGGNGKHVFVEPGHGGFWRVGSQATVVSIPDDSDRDLVFPAVLDSAGALDATATNSQPHANINIGGGPKMNAGSSIQMAAGYEGLGKGIGSGGVSYIYSIKVQQVGRNRAESTVCTKYQYNPGFKGNCYY